MIGVLLFSAVAGMAGAQPVQWVDDRGRTVRLAQPAQRIITLTPHLTELVFAAGAGSHLAGVARFSNHPPPARQLPVIGDAALFDAEQILRLRPDLVLAWKNGTPPAAVTRLENAGLPVFVSGVTELEGISRSIAAIATLAGTLAESTETRAAFDAGLRDLRARRHRGAAVRVFYEIWPEPLMTVNGKHIISDVIALCGGVNVFGALRPLTPEISREALLTAQPEVALGGSSAETDAGFAARWAKLPPPLGVLPAYYIPADLIQRPTPRLLEGARLVCRYLDAVRTARR